MSTRSGRRIHGSFHEPEEPTHEEPLAKTGKKTRSKRVKDNIEVLETTVTKSKKRNNYVRYPSDEESQDAPQIQKQKEESRSLRKNALKEQDLNITSTETIEVVDTKKPARLTRRTKKFAENPEEEVDQNGEKDAADTVAVEGKSKGKKNKKKKSKSEVPDENEVAVIPKKKNKRKKKKSSENNSEVKNSTLNQSNMSIDSFHSAAASPAHKEENTNLNNTFEKSPEKVEIDSNVTQSFPTRMSDRNRRRSAKSSETAGNGSMSATESKKSLRQNSTFEVIEIDNAKADVSIKVDTPNKRRTRQNSTFEVVEVETKSASGTKEHTPNKKQLTRQNTFEITEVENVNTTFEKVKETSRRSSIKNSTFDADRSSSKQGGGNSTFDKNKSSTPSKLNATFEKDGRRRSLRLSSAADVQPMNGIHDNEDQQPDLLNTTFDKETKLNSTFDKETKLNSTFDKDKSSSNKSSLITSDDTNLTFDKSDERISITSDDSRIENTTPVLIESSMDESRTRLNNSGGNTQNVQTPMKREGTFTKDSSDLEPKTSIENVRTPTKRMSLATPGSTPFPFSKIGQKEKALLNVTRSIEKSRLSFVDAAPSTRTTKVMFCSPVNNPVVVAQNKRKIIKSNLKGSNKSFVFEETAPSPPRAAPRKRSYTHNDVEEARAKRCRLDDQLSSVHRLSRPRTPAAKPAEPTTPSKRLPTPSKSKSETKVPRTKLPNFAALHQKRFEKMESLDECQERKAKRARQLLTPSASVNVLERSSPRGSEQGKAKEAIKKPEAKDNKSQTVKTKLARRPEFKTRVEPNGKIEKAGDRVEKRESRIAKAVRPEEDAEKTETRAIAKVAKDIPQKADPKPLPTLDSLQRGYTRFGFKMAAGPNPFSVPAAPEVKAREEGKKNGLTRLMSQPSLCGAAGARAEAARQLVLRLPARPASARRRSARDAERTLIKGVRTNRRFELQMRMRNVS